MDTLLSRARALAVGRVALMCSVVACSSPECLELPCPASLAAEISVTASNAPMGIAGLSMAISAAPSESMPCAEPSGPTTLCLLSGGPGRYHVTLSAPGYQSSTIDFTATGSAGGCNRCGQTDTKQLSVVMQPGTGSAGSRS